MSKAEPIKTIEEVQAIEKYLWFHNKRNHLIWSISVNTCMLLSDVLSLNISNIKSANLIELVDGAGMIKRIRLNTKVAKYLAMYMRSLRRVTNDTPLFRGQQGCRLDRTQVQRFLKEASKVVGITSNISISTMRRTFGRFHYLKYHNIVLLQHLLHQNSIKQTLAYIGFDTNSYDISYSDFEL